MTATERDGFRWCGRFTQHFAHDVCDGWADPRHEHSYAYDDAGRMRCDCGTYLFQHAPGHPVGVQAGPNGMSARWCHLEDCDWQETS